MIITKKDIIGFGNAKNDGKLTGFLNYTAGFEYIKHEKWKLSNKQL